ncbi:GntR family transcriptional regulator [Microvirga tunisiensis]|uniref:GntR family transcriptional regulator n=2 Tax=Pannonibacter tanglangensis TaxID=2750084 RepID=A0ABW9ZI99_9HYPH|nr:MULTISPECIES: GntR family transcriptional regulator [unclassified Pannonibacter]NBN64598.1 GntR family transcriptional regulator [Pannonibacter sp. XCT-34]NBN79133.1 GntR family transcriptional regulator [Pannonibacter sp. XCT-53]
MPKTEDAYLALRGAILDCSLAPDAPLTVSSLKDRFGFGWTPLREALSRLEAERLVVLAPNKGFRVAGVSAESLKDLQEARLALELRLLARSVAEGDQAWEAAVVAAHHLLASTPSPDPDAEPASIRLWEARHDAFHATLLAGATAPWLTLFATQISAQLRRHNRYMLSAPDVRQRMQDDRDGTLRALYVRTLGLAHHTLLMEAALDRDSARAEHLLTEHIGFSQAVYDTLWPHAAGPARAG